MFDPEGIYDSLRPYLINPMRPERGRGERIWSYCPAHDDGRSDGRNSPPSTRGGRSLSLSKTTGVHCFSGCSFKEIIEAFEKLGYDRQHALDEQPRGVRAVPEYTRKHYDQKLVDIYEYRDENGDLVAVKGRFEIYDGDDRKKTFRWKLPTAENWEGIPFGTEDLPLYGAELLKDKPDELVIFTEGEKAAKACRDAGLIAVCAGGGAQRQPKLGKALQVLRGRKVALWPDNDDIGRIYMRAIKAMLTGIADEIYWISVPLPDKGDAWDYFKVLNGKADDLYGILEKPSATIVSDDSLEVKYPFDEKVAHVILEHISRTRREIDANIIVEFSGKRFTQRINLLSSSSRQTLARELKSYFGEYEWNSMLVDLSSMAQEHIKRTSAIIDIASVVPPGKQQMFIAGFLPLGEASIVFGTGDSGKTYFCLYTALISSIGGKWFNDEWIQQSPVLWVDYETQRDGRTVRYRLDRLASGIGLGVSHGMVFYKPGSGTPFAEQYDEISTFVRSEGIGLIVVDSALKAVGGDVRNEVAVAQYFSAIQSLGITSVTLAHTTKDDNTDMPFGSVFWHNEPHGYIWHLSRVTDIPSESTLVLNNKKANDGARPSPIAVTFKFEDPDGPIQAFPTSIPQEHAAALGKSSKATIIDYLKQAGTASVDDIAAATGIIKPKVSSILGQYHTFLSEDGGKTWRLRQH